MPEASPLKATAPARKPNALKTQSLDPSSQARFATSKLIQNLGSSSDGIQFYFVSDLRTAYGRD